MDDWRYVKRSFSDGIHLTGKLQETFMNAYMLHVAAGRGYLFQAAVFVRSNASDDSYEFYFTPQAVYLIGSMIDTLGGKPCPAPPRRLPDEDRFHGLGLSVGEAGAWNLLADS